MMFVDKIQKLCLRRCDNGPEGNPRDLTRWNHQVISEREDRVENGPDRVRKWSAIPKGSRRADSPPPTHETSPVGLVLRIGGYLAFHDGEVSGPYLGLPVRARAACRGEIGRAHV